MSKKKPTFKPHSAAKQKHYERVARLQYGSDVVNQSINLWNSYTPEKQKAIQQEGGENYLAIVDAYERGLPAQHDEVQVLLQRWHDHIRYFYEPTLDILRGLGEAYKSEPGFIAFFEKIHPALPDYLAQGITQYVDDLEHAEIVRMFAEDESHAQTAQQAHLAMEMKPKRSE
jgi:hypothetical protein